MSLRRPRFEDEEPASAINISPLIDVIFILLIFFIVTMVFAENDAMGVDDIELISLAKREEEIFTVGSKESVRLDKRDYCLQMLQRIRDEAHRFAITFFRNIHSKRSLTSVLTEIPGVGKIKRKALIERFGTIDRIMKAAEADIAAVAGIGANLAAAIKQYFEEEL